MSKKQTKKTTNKKPSTKINKTVQNKKTQSKKSKPTQPKKSETQSKTTKSSEPFVLCSVTTPDKQIFHKRFRQSKTPTHCVLMQRLDPKRWATLGWSTSEKLAQRNYDRVMARYIDESSETFIEKRYAKAEIVTVTVVREMSADEKLERDLREDRSWAREIRKLRRAAASAAIALPFVSHIGDLTFSDLLNYLPL